MKENLHNIFTSGKCPTADDLQLYLRGSLSPEDANDIEQHLESCELCSEALKGLEAFGDSEKLGSITAELDTRVDNLVKEENSKMFVSGWYKIAAAVAIIFLAGGILFVNNQFNKNEKIFSEHYEAFEQNEEDSKAEVSGLDEDKPDESIILEAIEDLDANKAIENVEEENIASPSIISETPIAEEAVVEDKFSLDAVAENKELRPLKEKEAASDQMPVAEDMEASDMVLNKNTGTELIGNMQKQPVAIKSSTDDGMAIDESANESVQISADQVEEIAVMQSKDERNKKAQLKSRAYSEGLAKKANQAHVQTYFDAAKATYDKKQFEEAKQLFERALQIDEQHYQSKFFKALCDIELEYINEAISGLTELAKQRNAVLYDATLWYLALAHIKDDNPRKAKKVLTKLIEIEGEYKLKAEELLEKL